MRGLYASRLWIKPPEAGQGCRTNVLWRGPPPWRRTSHLAHVGHLCTSVSAWRPLLRNTGPRLRLFSGPLGDMGARPSPCPQGAQWQVDEQNHCKRLVSCTELDNKDFVKDPTKVNRETERIPLARAPTKHAPQRIGWLLKGQSTQQHQVPQKDKHPLTSDSLRPHVPVVMLMALTPNTKPRSQNFPNTMVFILKLGDLLFCCCCCFLVFF